MFWLSTGEPVERCVFCQSHSCQEFRTSTEVQESVRHQFNLFTRRWTRHGVSQSRILGMRTSWSHQQLRWTISTVTMTEAWPWAERRITRTCSRLIQVTEVISPTTSWIVHDSHVHYHEWSQCQVRTPDPTRTQAVITSHQTTYTQNHVQNNEVLTTR